MQAPRRSPEAPLELEADALTRARGRVSAARRRVVKIGTARLTRTDGGLDVDAIEACAEELARLAGELVVVSSGAVAAGLGALGLRTRPDRVDLLQAAAAVGQAHLVQAWERAFARHDRRVALVLLTHEDLADRRRYLNARSTLQTLLAHGVVPIVNENDTVATEEIRVGDNDTLAALVSHLVEAELLTLLTDVRGLHDRDPRRDPQARLLSAVAVDDARLDAMVSGPAGRHARGGMITKLSAARRAARSGTLTLVTDDVADMTVGGGGTLLVPERAPLAARKRWIAERLQIGGTLVLDAGAVRVVERDGRSLLPVGVVAVEGDFDRGAVVLCRDEAGREVARGLVNYPAREIERILGHGSDAIAERLGYVAESELVHRDNLVLTGRERP